MPRICRDVIDPRPPPKADAWRLVQIIVPQDMEDEGETKCDMRQCQLTACVVYRQSIPGQNEGDEPAVSLWYLCLDCQQSEMNGWPLHEDMPDVDLHVAQWPGIHGRCSVREFDTAIPPFPCIVTFWKCVLLMTLPILTHNIFQMNTIII